VHLSGTNNDFAVAPSFWLSPDVFADSLLAPNSPDRPSQLRAAVDKVYLVYIDAPVALPGVCGVTIIFPGQRVRLAPAYVLLQPQAGVDGRGCRIEQLGRGNGATAIVAAHELVHALQRPHALAMPHACSPTDPAHVCGDPADLMYPDGSGGDDLDTRVLDVGHDDYYAHGGLQWDVQDSSWLTHLDVPQVTLRVSTGAGAHGTVESTPAALGCPGVCRLPWDRGSVVALQAFPDEGYAVGGWKGCDGTGPLCAVSLNRDTAVQVHFVKLVDVRVQVVGPGSVTTADGDFCADRCTWRLGNGKDIATTAVPDDHARFDHWEGATCAQRRRHCVLEVKAGARLVAVFAKGPSPPAVRSH
jgi:hypothetical protein